MKRCFVLYDGSVTNKDGDIHNINALDLIELYKVRSDTCIKFKDIKRTEDINSYIPLYPKEDGDYDLYKSIRLHFIERFRKKSFITKLKSLFL